MPCEWKTYKLSDILVITGGGTPKTNNNEYWDGNIPWLSVTDFANSKKYVYEAEKSITEKGLSESSANVLRKGNIIISARGTVGEMAVLGNDMAFNQSCYGLTANKKTFNDFLYYLLKFNITKIKKNVHGAVFDTITQQSFDNIEVKIPDDLEEQRKIASILTSLDDKIELNLQMNKTLEAMAQAIYKEWFVNFNFPGFNGELVDGLPKGWRKGKLGEICSNIKNSFNPIQTLQELHYIGLEHIPRKNLSLINWGNSTEISSQKSKFQSGDILFGKLRPYFHKVILVGFDGICSTDILVIRSLENYYQHYSLFRIFDDDCIQYANSHSDGTRMPRVNWASLSKYEIIIPSTDILYLFQKVIKPFFEKIHINIFENQSLIQIRDHFLPKLMSGKIVINH